MNFPNKILDRTCKALTLIIGVSWLSSCHIIPDQGPTGINKLQNQQAEGVLDSDEYVILDIRSDNLHDFNKPVYRRSGTIPKVNSSKIYSDLIARYDRLTLLVIDTAEQGAFANSRGPVTFGPLEVPANGLINVPYAGEFNVLGKSVATVQSEIAAKYSSIFNTAEISLNRTSRQPLRASVIGLVKNPGQHVIDRKGVTLAELIALSGGTEEEPFLSEYLIHREKKTYNITNDQITKLKLTAQDGDLIEIKRSAEHSITMMGSVNRPGNHRFPKRDCKLSDFLGEGRGISLNNADATGVFVFRKVGGITHLYRFNLQKPEGLVFASKFHIHGGDIVYVTEAPLAKWGRVIRGILPFGQLQSLSNAATLGN